MKELLALLQDGRSRTIEMLAVELNTTTQDILRKIDFLENSGIIRRVAASYEKKCSGCSSKLGCNGKVCSSCMPKEGFKNMGFMWEVVK